MSIFRTTIKIIPFIPLRGDFLRGLIFTTNLLFSIFMSACKGDMANEMDNIK